MKTRSYEPIQKTGRRLINQDFALPFCPFLLFLPLSFAIVKQEVTLANNNHQGKVGPCHFSMRSNAETPFGLHPPTLS